MKVKELIALLQKQDQDLDVIVASIPKNSDENYYYPLDNDICDGYYMVNSTTDTGEFYSTKIVEETDPGEYVKETRTKVICLWPIN